MKRFLDFWLRWRAVMVTLLTFLVLWIMKTFFTMNFGFYNPIPKIMEDFSMTDIYYQIGKKEPEPNHYITIVDMTDLVRRGDIAHALEMVMACEPAVVGVDMVFQGERTDSAGNEAIKRVAATYDNIVWSVEATNPTPDGDHTYARRSFFIEETGATEGACNMQASQYSRMKRKLVKAWSLNGKLIPSIICSVVNMYAGEEVQKVEDTDLAINFVPTKFTVIPWREVEANADLLADRIVLFGAMHEDSDMHNTPLGKIAGLELLAYGVQTLINGNEVKEVSFYKLLFYSFLIVLVTYVLRSRRKGWIDRRRNPLSRLLLGFPVVNSFISFIWVALLMGGAYFIFSTRDVSFNLGYALAGIAFLSTAESSYNIIRDYLKDKVNEKDNS